MNMTRNEKYLLIIIVIVALIAIWIRCNKQENLDVNKNEDEQYISPCNTKCKLELMNNITDCKNKYDNQEQQINCATQQFSVAAECSQKC